MTDEPAAPRRTFRVLTRRRDAYDGGVMVDVQLQRVDTGALVWSQSFSDGEQAEGFQHDLEADLETLDDGEFRRKYGIPPSS